jgi:hypothetical protein
MELATVNLINSGVVVDVVVNVGSEFDIVVVVNIVIPMNIVQ